VGLSLGFRVKAPKVSAHTCICCVAVQTSHAARLHGLSCRRSAGHQSGHHAANEIIARAFRRVGVPLSLEPPRLIRGDGKRPDGAALIPFGISYVHTRWPLRTNKKFQFCRGQQRWKLRRENEMCTYPF